jgi:hypothetical protein
MCGRKEAAEMQGAVAKEVQIILSAIRKELEVAKLEEKVAKKELEKIETEGTVTNAALVQAEEAEEAEAAEAARKVNDANAEEAEEAEAEVAKAAEEVEKLIKAAEEVEKLIKAKKELDSLNAKESEQKITDIIGKIEDLAGYAAAAAAAAAAAEKAAAERAPVEEAAAAAAEKAAAKPAKLCALTKEEVIDNPDRLAEWFGMSHAGYTVDDKKLEIMFIGKDIRCWCANPTVEVNRSHIIMRYLDTYISFYRSNEWDKHMFQGVFHTPKEDSDHYALRAIQSDNQRYTENSFTIYKMSFDGSIADTLNAFIPAETSKCLRTEARYPKATVATRRLKNAEDRLGRTITLVQILENQAEKLRALKVQQRSSTGKSDEENQVDKSDEEKQSAKYKSKLVELRKQLSEIKAVAASTKETNNEILRYIPFFFTCATFFSNCCVLPQYCIQYFLSCPLKVNYNSCWWKVNHNCTSYVVKALDKLGVPTDLSSRNGKVRAVLDVLNISLLGLLYYFALLYKHKSLQHVRLGTKIFGCIATSIVTIIFSAIQIPHIFKLRDAKELVQSTFIIVFAHISVFCSQFISICYHVCSCKWGLALAKCRSIFNCKWDIDIAQLVDIAKLDISCNMQTWISGVIVLTSFIVAIINIVILGDKSQPLIETEFENTKVHWYMTYLICTILWQALLYIASICEGLCMRCNGFITPQGLGEILNRTESISTGILKEARPGVNSGGAAEQVGTVPTSVEKRTL